MAALLAVGASLASAATHYVSLTNATPQSPYDTWPTAAANIQQAVAASAAGDEVVVSNGVFSDGGLAVYSTMTNRVALVKRITLRSVNGPSATVIQGAKGTGGTNGFGAVRCVYLAGGAIVSGFTLTQGATRSIGDAIREMSGGGVWCAADDSIVTNCVISNNSAAWAAGGAYGGTLQNCTLSGNSAGNGGGASAATLSLCTLATNSAGYGGGADSSTLASCWLRGNSARQEGGGAWSSTLLSCALLGNSAQQLGGGAASSRLVNCTLVQNTALQAGGGACYGSLTNCIVYFNTAPSGSNYTDPKSDVGPVGPSTNSTLFVHSCTSPLPPGPGNIAVDPNLVNPNTGELQLKPDSPCLDAGTDVSWLLSTDLEGFPRAVSANASGPARPDMGAYEFDPSRSELWLRMVAPSLDVRILGQYNRLVRIDHSSNLVDWVPATTFTNSAGSAFADPEASLAPHLFYRARTLP